MNKLGRLRKKAGLTLAMALVMTEAANLQYIPAYAATTGTVTCDVLNVRSGGSTDSSVITTLTKGSQVEILSSENGWYAISVNGTTGYVSAQYVSTDDGSGSGSGSVDTSVAGQSGSVNVGVLNLRSDASTDSSVIGALYSGQAVTVNESINGWYKVTTTSGTSGYVYAQYITLGGSTGGGDNNNTNNNGNSGGSTVDVTPASGEGVCNTSALNVRSDANTNASVLGYITNGTKVTITGTTGSWYKVDTTIGGSKVSGFVYATYITLGSGSSNNGGTDGNSNNGGTSVEPASGEGICNTSALNVRKDASTSAATYGTIRQGDKVTILGKSGEWYQVKTTVNGSEVDGFVHSSYITISTDNGNSNNNNNNSNGSETPDQVDPASGEGICNTTALNVRKEASTSAGVHGLIYKDDKVTITGKTGSWYQVTAKVNGSEVTGYVHTDYITLTDSNSNNNNNNNSNGSNANNSADIKEVDETVWATAAVNVRKEATTSSGIVATLRKDASVKRTGVLNNGWSRVSYNGESAYIFSEYLTTTNPDPNGGNASGSGSSGINGVTGEDIVAYAKQWVGYPYVWGGNNLSTGVDCSGFTQQVYLHFGITLNRIADAQKQNGIRIASVSEAKAGDLFFYGSSSYADHVAIYMGDGNVVHASSPSVGIIISPISYRTPVAIVRVIY